MAHQLKLYEDSKLEKPVTEFKFPRTDLGDDAYIDFYLYNGSEKWPIVEIRTESKHKETEVLDVPQMLQPKQKAYCRYKWTPSLETDEPLTSILVISGELHIG